MYICRVIQAFILNIIVITIIIFIIRDFKMITVVIIVFITVIIVKSSLLIYILFNWTSVFLMRCKQKDNQFLALGLSSRIHKKNFIGWSNFEMKESIEVHLNGLKKFLLYFCDAYDVNLRVKRSGCVSLIHAKHVFIEFHHFKKKRWWDSFS